MIGWEDVYKVVVAMVPLYVALILGYGSVKWWRMFTADQCDAINRMNCYFIQPLFTFDFTAHINPFKMNLRFIAAEIISKVIIGILLAVWCYFRQTTTTTNYWDWPITAYSLFSLNNTLVVGVPLLNAMYGKLGMDLVIQSSILQSILWFMVLLFLLELRRTRQQSDIESVMTRPPSFRLTMKLVLIKLAKNPNSYACIIGLVWAFLSNRWKLKMPGIVEGSILILSTSGAGVSMFCIGLFMAAQNRIIACGIGPTILAMVLRFIGAPLIMSIVCIALRLHDDVLQIVIIQSALPQAVSAFIFAKEYDLHTDVISTAVAVGTLISLPIMIAYYAFLEVIN